MNNAIVRTVSRKNNFLFWSKCIQYLWRIIYGNSFKIFNRQSLCILYFCISISFRYLVSSCSKVNEFDKEYSLSLYRCRVEDFLPREHCQRSLSFLSNPEILLAMRYLLQHVQQENERSTKKRSRLSLCTSVLVYVYTQDSFLRFCEFDRGYSSQVIPELSFVWIVRIFSCCNNFLQFFVLLISFLSLSFARFFTFFRTYQSRCDCSVRICVLCDW